MRPAVVAALAAVVAALAAVALAGCGLSGKTVSHSGAVGDAFSGPGGLRVQPVRFLARVRSRPDVTGLGTAAPGTRLAAILVRVCVDTAGLPTISQRNFELDLDGGGQAALKFPETLFADDLNLLGEPGCERGHVVFQVPRGARPVKLRFGLDWTTPTPDGTGRGTKVRFTWKV
jgi:hypothetical protein